MSNSMTIHSGIKSPKVLIVLGATIAASTAMTAPLADEDGDSSQSLRLAYSIQATGKTTPTSDPTCPLKVVVSGAGLTNLLHGGSVSATSLGAGTGGVFTVRLPMVESLLPSTTPAAS